MRGATVRAVVVSVLVFGIWAAPWARHPAFSASGRAHRHGGGTPAEAVGFGDDFAWQQEGPEKFLSLLRARAQGPDAPYKCYTVHGWHVGWLRKSDLPRLLTLVESREPCAHVRMSVSKVMPVGVSFVGQEALFLIEGYRRGVYPPELHSGAFYDRKDEIVAWARERIDRQDGGDGTP